MGCCHRSARISILLLASTAHGTLSAAEPVEFDWRGEFTSTWSSSTVEGGEDLIGCSFRVTFTIDDPGGYYLPQVRYDVDATLHIDGLDERAQRTTFRLSPYSTNTASIGPFENVITAGDAIFFGICTGGACVDNFLWNGDLLKPAFNLRRFHLGLDSSCYGTPPCGNANMNWFGTEPTEGFTVFYVGTLDISGPPDSSFLIRLLPAILSERP